MTDFPDWDPLPQMTAATTGLAVSNVGVVGHIIAADVNHAIRLWTVSIAVVNPDTTQRGIAYVQLSTGAQLMVATCPAPPSAAAPATDHDALYFGGVVLPKGAGLDVLCAGGAAAQAVATATWTRV